MSWEIILVDDGSHDDTFRNWPPCIWRIRGSKSFLFHAISGIRPRCSRVWLSRGEVVAVMDADLQDPPECLADCLTKLNEGYDVVYAVRRQRKENPFKRICYAAFYRVLNLIAEMEIPLDSGDFCVMRQCVVSVLRSMPEREVFVRGLAAGPGSPDGHRIQPRAARAGDTKYRSASWSGWRSRDLAFSAFPLRLAAYWDSSAWQSRWRAASSSCGKFLTSDCSDIIPPRFRAGLRLSV